MGPPTLYSSTVGEWGPQLFIPQLLGNGVCRHLFTFLETVTILKSGRFNTYLPFLKALPSSKAVVSAFYISTLSKSILVNISAFSKCHTVTPLLKIDFITFRCSLGQLGIFNLTSCVLT